MFENLPVLGICGDTDSARMELIEQIVPELRQRGLKVAVIRYDSNGMPQEWAGSDADRLYHAGVDVLSQGPRKSVLQLHARSMPEPGRAIEQFIRQYDLVLVDGREDARVSKVWLLGEGEDRPAPEILGIVRVLPRGPQRCGQLLAMLDAWLPHQSAKTPVYGCILIGGCSKRMGQPKHLIRREGRTWLEWGVEVLSQVTRQVAIVGGGEIPDTLTDRVRLVDAPDARGPLAGVLTAMRWAPAASWLVMACDMPFANEHALEWLLSKRRPGTWAVLPVADPAEGSEPMLAWYDFRARGLLEGMAQRRRFRLRELAGQREVSCPEVPAELRPAWCNINTPGEMVEDMR